MSDTQNIITPYNTMMENGVPVWIVIHHVQQHIDSLTSLPGPLYKVSDIQALPILREYLHNLRQGKD